MDCELSCDEAVLGMLTQQGRRMYGNVLLDVAEQNAAAMKSVLTTTFITGNSELKRRLQNVLTFKKLSMVKILLSICVMAGTMFLTACGSVYLSDGSFREADFDDDEAFSDSNFLTMDGIISLASTNATKKEKLTLPMMMQDCWPELM